MCRFFILICNSGKNIDPARLAKCLLFDDHSLFKQCYKPPFTPKYPIGIVDDTNHSLNLDGYGLGFYFNNKNINSAKMYKNIIPPWNDTNLHNLLQIIDSNIIFAHIRATYPIQKCAHNLSISSPVHIHNCHPFCYNEYMFCHNGLIGSFFNGKNRKAIINHINDDLLLKIQGNTDSEYVFYLILTFVFNRISLFSELSGVSKLSMTRAIIKTINFLSKIDQKSKLSFNSAFTNKKEVIITRYSNYGVPPSLYFKRTKKCIMIASEPINNKGWELIKANHILTIKKSKIRMKKIN